MVEVEIVPDHPTFVKIENEGVAELIEDLGFVLRRHSVPSDEADRILAEFKRGLYGTICFIMDTIVLARARDSTIPITGGDFGEFPDG